MYVNPMTAAEQCLKKNTFLAEINKKIWYYFYISSQTTRFNEIWLNINIAYRLSLYNAMYNGFL